MKRLIFLLIVSLSFAAIEFSGDARFRPRLDVQEYGINDEDGNIKTSDLYYLYRARINMKADIGDGWFFKSKLGTNSVAGMTKMGPSSDNNDGPGNSNSHRPTLSFLELYYGYAKEDCGFWVGAFPLKYTPALDLHFYSDKLVDIPFVLYNNSSINGFAGYQVIKDKKINWFLSVDLNNTNSAESLPGNETTEKDMYTLGLNSSFDVLNLTLTPNILLAIGDGDLPTTYGLDIDLPELSDISSSISYHMTNYDATDGDHFRVKMTKPVGKGSMKFFYDIANMEDDSMSYMWLSYTHTCYKGDAGTVTISPTYRYQDGGYIGETFDKDYNRIKFEITTEIKFF